MADKKKNYNQENALRLGFITVLAMVALVIAMGFNLDLNVAGTASKNSNTICSDSDGGQREFFVGTVGVYNGDTYKLLKSYPDTCAADGKTLTEYICNEQKTDRKSVTITCPGECSGGECKCYDSDGGRNLYVKGTTIWRGGTYVDRCYDTNRVYEFRCDNNIMYGSYDECTYPDYCSNGVCVKPVCGNGIVERGEDCDGSNLLGNDCTRLGFFGGTLACTRDCKYDTSRCINQVCGDGIINQMNEQCDGNDFGSLTCELLGFLGGTLACKGDCILDTSRCNVCSDSDGGLNYEARGTVRNIEGNTKTDTCGVAGFNPTDLCGDPMGSFDSTCAANALVEHYCGGNTALDLIKVNGVFSLGRTDCSYDSYPLDGYVYVSCGTSGTQKAPIGADGSFTLIAPWDGTIYQFYLVSLGTANSDIRSARPIMTYKNIQCRKGCSDGACQSDKICGDGIINQINEQCDGNDFGSLTCESLGFTGGTLACDAATCTYNTDRCIQSPNYCGNILIEPGEECDGTNLGGRTCTYFGNFTAGTLACTDMCTFDFTNCY
ncbi:hypothetical protein JXB28_05220 [Candidatus Woesearchaeota archaeon]|nr:hypothetical protein [Candidatus Woesearchaeota archaeon]